MDFDGLLEKLGLTYEKLTKDEKASYDKMLKTMSVQPLTIDDFKEHLQVMRDSVSLEVSKPGKSKEEDLDLKARLRVYILLYQFLTTPERAKKALTRHLESL